MDNLTFDPHGLSRHNLTYTTLSKIHTKENFYLLIGLQQKKINVDVMVKEETKKT